jgi:steroid delta-isomerase-like uncharacterized protein
MATISTLQPVTPAFAQEFSDKFVEAWNSHQPERVLSMMTEEALYEDSGWPQPMRGRPAIRQFLTATWQAVPDLRIEITEGPMVDPRRPMAVTYWRATGTHTGLWNPPGLDATERSLSFAGASLIEFRDNKVSRAHVVYDVADVMRQLGLLPAQGSRPERAMMRMANVATRVRNRRRAS